MVWRGIFVCILTVLYIEDEKMAPDISMGWWKLGVDRMFYFYAWPIATSVSTTMCFFLELWPLSPDWPNHRIRDTGCTKNQSDIRNSWPPWLLKIKNAMPVLEIFCTYTIGTCYKFGGPFREEIW